MGFFLVRTFLLLLRGVVAVDLFEGVGDGEAVDGAGV